MAWIQAGTDPRTLLRPEKIDAGTCRSITRGPGEGGIRAMHDKDYPFNYRK
ncbi:MAG TPA: hypothetical protein HA272_08490 [Methanoregula sp.]|nr:hypothetical protein [Methanoregula sp.]